MAKRKSSEIPLSQMIAEAISTLKETSSGSSQPAIAEFIEDNYDKALLPPNFKKLLSVELKKLVESQKLTDELDGADQRRKSWRTKRLSQVKTPEGLKVKNQNKKKKKKKKGVVEEVDETVEVGQKVKRLSDVKTPEALKKKKKTKKNTD